MLIRPAGSVAHTPPPPTVLWRHGHRGDDKRVHEACHGSLQQRRLRVLRLCSWFFFGVDDARHGAIWQQRRVFGVPGLPNRALHGCQTGQACCLLSATPSLIYTRANGVGC